MTDKSGSAFPFPEIPLMGVKFELGLTKREYFAAIALQGSLAGLSRGDITSEQLADLAVKDADALIAELSVELSAGKP